MNPREITELIDSMHASEQRLEALTAGEVDAVSDRRGHSMLLRRAQEHLRAADAARQAAILDALPARIALLDPLGAVVSVNGAWRLSADTGEAWAAGCGVGADYLQACDCAQGDDESGARCVAAGIRKVLGGESASHSVEYASHSAAGQRWFLMTAIPLADDPPGGVVVMHLDISARKEAEARLRGLNRVYAVLSGISALIVRASGREELFGEACRIAVEQGGFEMAWVGLLDKDSGSLNLVASAGDASAFLESAAVKAALGQPAQGLVGQAIAEGKPAISNDISSDPRILVSRELRARAIRSAAIVPLIAGGDPAGVLALYAGEPAFFDDEETRLLVELAGNLSFALDHIGGREKLRYLAYYDALTGLANHGLFLERVVHSLSSAAIGGNSQALFLIDLERFKDINDSLGQAAGDELLRQVAAVLTATAGDAVRLARVGADRFALLLADAKTEGDVASTLEDIIKSLLDHSFRLGDADFRIAAKIGVAVYPADGVDAATLFRHAEAALKKAKASGNRYLFYAQKMTEAVAGRLALENQLRQALLKEEFVLHYQPTVSLASGRIVGAEALIRWNDPHTGLVPPGRFIPILEESGLIHEVGGWALRVAIAQSLRWRSAGYPAIRIAVNVSPLQLRDPGFVEEVRLAIGVDPVAAACLELEITENVIMEDVARSIASLSAIRAMGVTIAIDDFGTGFSSLSYLSKLPVDTLKIDRSFVGEMTATPTGLALTSTIITLAHSLKLNVVAEGVETEEQSRLLRLLNCDEMQGFLFSKAVPRDDFEERFLLPIQGDRAA